MANEIHFGAIPIEDIQIGMKVSYSQTITDSDIKIFAGFQLNIKKAIRVVIVIEQIIIINSS